VAARNGESSEMMGRSSVPLFAYQRLPGVPPLSVSRLFGPIEHFPHAHDFLVLLYVERGGGSATIDGRVWTPEAGDAFVLAPRAVVDPTGLGDVAGWMAYFPPDVLAPHSPGAFLSWRAHPLLFAFAGAEVRGGSGVQRLRVPEGERGAWGERFAALDRELRERRDGYNEAALAQLTLLLVAVSRLAPGSGLQDDPLLAKVFEYIEAEHVRPISLRDVAAAVGLSPAHLTTVIARKTGRTVQQWIAARRLLVETDDTVDSIALAVGFRDTGYFTKRFRRSHDLTPLQWRRAGRR
jgi:AraC family transcriptional activator of pobA